MASHIHLFVLLADSFSRKFNLTCNFESIVISQASLLLLVNVIVEV